MPKHMTRITGERANRNTDSSTGTSAAKSTETAKEMSRKLDALLDEIDAVLERNAEEFVASYVQHGGE